MHPLLANLQETPFVQYGHRAVSKPEGVLEEWEFFTELALAMGRDMFGKRGTNRAIGMSRWFARALRRPNLALNPEWFQRAMVAMGRGVSWKGIVSRPHGWRYAEPRFGDMANALRTPDKHVQVAPPRIVASCRQAIASRPVTTPDFPLVLINKRSRTSMNSWLNETPGLWSHGRTNVAELHPQDAETCGVTSGDMIRVSSVTGSVELCAEVSDAMRPGIVCIPHGWGSTIYDPTVEGPPVTYGTNRNLLVDNNDLDSLSQIPKLNSTAVAVQRVPQGGSDSSATSKVSTGAEQSS
jgi:formate dehydrogenase